MIGLLLASALLLSDGDDCAVLEAAVATPWPPENDLFAAQPVAMPTRNFVGFRPARLGVVERCGPSSPHDTLSSSEIGVCEQEAILRFDAASPEERQFLIEPAGQLFFSQISADAPLAWITEDGGVTVPDGLPESFSASVLEHQNWGCRSADWQYVEGDYYRGVAGINLQEISAWEPGYYIAMTRPGYSADGQWAVLYYQDATIFDSPLAVEAVGQVLYYASQGYRIFEHQSGNWAQVSQHETRSVTSLLVAVKEAEPF